MSPVGLFCGCCSMFHCSDLSKDQGRPHSRALMSQIAKSLKPRPAHFFQESHSPSWSLKGYSHILCVCRENRDAIREYYLGLLLQDGVHFSTQTRSTSLQNRVYFP